MVFGFLNGVPGVGHVIGLGHVLRGNSYEAREAFSAANRSTLVTVGAVAGLAGGPGGAVAGAMAAGVLADTLESCEAGKPCGIIKGADMMVKDVQNGDFPIGSACVTTIMVCSDALGGLGGAGVVNAGMNALKQEASKSLLKTVAVEVTKSIIKDEGVVIVGAAVTRQIGDGFSNVCNEVQSEKHSEGSSASSQPKQTKPTQSDGKQDNSNPSSSTSGGGSGPPPPPRSNKKDRQSSCLELLLSMFLAIFNVTSLADIVILGKRIFKDLNDPQLSYLWRQISMLNEMGILKPVVEAVIGMFNKLGSQTVSFENFLSLLQFVATYIQELLQSSYARLADLGSNANRTFDQLCVTIGNIVEGCVDIFNALAGVIKGRRKISPDYRDEFAAVYHYYKHRKLPNGEILEVSEYYELMEKHLARVKQLPAYRELQDPKHSRRVIKYQKYVRALGGRIVIVLKARIGSIVISSFYVIVFVPILDEDTDGDEYLDGKKME